MQIFQDGSSIIPAKPAVPASPVRQLYGKKTMPSGKVLLIAPLDIIFMQFDNILGEVFAPPAIPGTLISNIVTSGGKPVGTIMNYDYPTLLSNIIPVVFIDSYVDPSTTPPNNTFDLTNIPNIGTSSLPIVSIGTVITLVNSEDKAITTGVVVNNVLESFDYPDGNSSVDAFAVTFNSTLLEQVHGARVLVGGKNGRLLGMIIATAGAVALVFPANQI